MVKVFLPDVCEIQPVFAFEYWSFDFIQQQKFSLETKIIKGKAGSKNFSLIWNGSRAARTILLFVRMTIRNWLKKVNESHDNLNNNDSFKSSEEEI